MKKRIRCPFHKEKTPSLVRRRYDYYCYGGCGKSYTTKEVEDKTGQHYEYDEEETEKEDIAETFRYIKSLKLVEHRGFKFPSDERGYFVPWPGEDFYKYRVLNPGKGSKYLGPKGHVPPTFIARETQSGQLAIVEGEINALSFAKGFENWDVISPGSASMFKPDTLTKYLTPLKNYSNVLVILDNDSAGFKAYMETKAFLLYKVPFLTFKLMDKDCNDWLCEGGVEALREAVQRTDSK